MSTVSFRLDFGRLPRERSGTAPVVYEVTKQTLVGHGLGYNGVLWYIRSQTFYFADEGLC